LDRETYLTVVDKDGNNRRSAVFESFERETLVALTTIHGWSGDGEYLTMDEGVPSGYQDARRYTVWSTDELRWIPTILDERPVQFGVWSPQGHTIAAVTGSRDEPKELVIFSPGDTPIIVPLPERPYVHIDWSPDSRYFALSSPLLMDMGGISDQWQFDLYASTGELLHGGLVGTMLNNGTGLPSLYAKWSPDSRLWVYLLDRRQNQLDLVGLDVTTGLHKVIASNLASGLARDIFHMQWRNSNGVITVPASTIDANTIFVPRGNRILISKWRDEKVTLEIADLDGSNAVTLVDGAEYIYYPQNSPVGGAGWSSDGSEIKVLWSSGSDMRLTVAKTDGSDVYTLADDIDEIAYPRDVLFTRFGPRWFGFITRRDNGYGVEVYDRETHAHYRLLSGLTAASDSWSLSPNPDQTYVAITVGKVAARQTNRLFVAPLNGQPAREIHADVIGEPVWSADGQELIYAYQIQPRIYTVERVSLDGTILGSMRVRARVGVSSRLSIWNECE
jgi:Tol biopolymer transport system component